MAGFEARSFRGCGVMTSEPFEVSDDNESLQMLTRNSQIGEFYVMSPPQVAPQQGDSAMYTCDIMIFDEERDAHVRISWNEALKATLCGGGEEGGTPSKFLEDHGSKNLVRGPKEKKSFAEWAKAAAAWADFNDGKKDDKGKPVKDYATLAQDFGVDIRIVVARPFIEHAMHNVIMAVSGRDTGPVGRSNPPQRPTRRALTVFPQTTAGATLFGPADMQLSANTQVKTIEGHCESSGRSNHAQPLAAAPACVLTAPPLPRQTLATSRPWSPSRKTF